MTLRPHRSLDRLYRPLTAGDRDRIAEHYVALYRGLARYQEAHEDELNLKGAILLELAKEAARREWREARRIR